jgi:hypothetical protein
MIAYAHSIKFVSNISRHARTYVAATYVNTDKIPARIVHQPDTIQLQVLTSHHIGENLRGKVSLRERFLGTDWHTLLNINNDKNRIVYEENYFDHQLVQSKMCSTSPEYIIFPKNLYGVSQSIWESFIACLKHQEVVQLLNLKQHRHLWPAYQYALSAPTLTIVRARASIIGQFHFLLSLVLNDLDTVKKHQQDYRKEFDLSILSLIKHELDGGDFSKKNMEKFHHCLTAQAVNKLRYCTNILDLNLLAVMVSSFANTTRQLPNDSRKSGAVNMLPCSTVKPHDMASALKFAKIANHISVRPGLLFFNSKLQWGRALTEEDNLEKAHHYFDALFHDLLKRQILLQAHALNIPVNSDVLHAVKEHFESLLLHKMAMNKIVLLQTYWQHHSHMTTSFKPSHHQVRFWSPLLEHTTIDDITIRSLASVDSLRQHGQKMRHCVQTDVFIDCCRRMEADILELKSEDGEMSTLDLRKVYDGDYYILQHVGVMGNQPPSKRHLSVGIKLLEDMRAGRVKLSEARKFDALNEHVKTSYQFDYELDDLKTQQDIYQLYKSKKMLPSCLIHADYSEMLEKNNLVNMIHDILIECSMIEKISHQSSFRNY